MANATASDSHSRSKRAKSRPPRIKTNAFQNVGAEGSLRVFSFISPPKSLQPIACTGVRVRHLPCGQLAANGEAASQQNKSTTKISRVFLLRYSHPRYNRATPARKTNIRHQRRSLCGQCT